MDPSTVPFEPILDPVNDRHSAQHNVTVMFVAPGKSFQLAVEVANIGGFAQPVRVLVQALGFRQTTARLETLRIPLRDELVETGRPFPLRVSLSDERSFLHRGNAAFARMLLAADERASSRMSQAAPDRGTTLVDLTTERFAPWERRHSELRGEVPGWAKSGEVFGFEVTEYLGEIMTGGYVALVVVGKGSKAPLSGNATDGAHAAFRGAVGPQDRMIGSQPVGLDRTFGTHDRRQWNGLMCWGVLKHHPRLDGEAKARPSCPMQSGPFASEATTRSTGMARQILVSRPGTPLAWSPSLHSRTGASQSNSSCRVRYSGQPHQGLKSLRRSIEQDACEAADPERDRRDQGLALGGQGLV
jgi:hypothetical protein